MDEVQPRYFKFQQRDLSFAPSMEVDNFKEHGENGQLLSGKCYAMIDPKAKVPYL